MLLRVTKAEMLTQDIRFICLEASKGEALPQPEPGAHIELQLPINGECVRRQYSLISSLDQLTHYDIAVKRHSDSRGGSIFLHDILTIGDELEVSHPPNGFEIEPEGKHFILFAGGIGITPMLSMVASLRKSGVSYELHYASKTESDMAFREQLLGTENVSLYFTREKHPNRMNVDTILNACIGHSDAHIYVCGPTNMIENVRLAATRHGFQPNCIHFESFGPHWEPSDQVVRMNLTESGVEIEVSPGTTLLDAMESAGAWIASDCKRGECGACITSYSAGTPIHRDHCLTQEQRRHSFCPCVSWATSDTELSIQL